jgi:drug/metabolite transporter (DMT)-like permease
MRWHLLFPLASSLLYVAGVLLIKRTAAFGVGVWRTTFVSNLAVAAVFLALLPMGGSEWRWAESWQPLIVAVLYVGGQALTFLALETGDVSVATPALGAKTIWVAWLTTLLLGTRLPWQLWAAAFLTFAAIGLLNFGGGAARNPGRTVLLSLSAAATYALFDVLVQKWSPAWGAGHFLPLMFGMAAVLSFGFAPLFRGPLREVPRAAWPWLAGGALCGALQAMFLVTTIATFGDATAVNVIYSARGLWSVAAVWLIGHWFRNTEGQLGPRLLRVRLAGAALMTVAIVVILTR